MFSMQTHAQKQWLSQYPTVCGYPNVVLRKGKVHEKFADSYNILYKYINSVQSLSQVWLFVTPWTEARQVSLSINNSQSLPKFMSIELVMPSNHLILCRPLLLLPSIFPSIGAFSSEFGFSGSQSIGASASVLPMNIQGWCPLGLTGLILQSKGFSKSLLQHHNSKASIIQRSCCCWVT